MLQLPPNYYSLRLPPGNDLCSFGNGLPWEVLETDPSLPPLPQEQHVSTNLESSPLSSFQQLLLRIQVSPQCIWLDSSGSIGEHCSRNTQSTFAVHSLLSLYLSLHESVNSRMSHPPPPPRATMICWMDSSGANLISVSFELLRGEGCQRFDSIIFAV